MIRRKGIQFILAFIFCFAIGALVYPQIDKPIDEIIERGDSDGLPEERIESRLEIDETEDVGSGIVSMPDEPSPQRQAELKVLFLSLDKVKIHRYKPAYRLSEDEMKLYLNFVRGGGIRKVMVEKTHDLEMTHIEVITNGSELMQHISYEHLFAIINHLIKKTEAKQAKEKKIDVPPIFKTRNKKIRFVNDAIVMLIQGKENVRLKVIESALGGLINPDPRVRLISTDLLRRLIPEPITWKYVNERIKEQQYGVMKNPLIRLDATYETVRKDPYYYKRINKDVANRIIFTELLKLRRFISRFILVQQIQNGDEGSIRSIPVEVFKLLEQPIENEGYCRIPMNYFKSETEINVITAGLKNKDPYIRRGCSSALIRIVRTRDVGRQLKRKIFTSLLKSPFRERVAKGWTDEEINKLTDDETDRMVKAYFKKVGLINACPGDADDRYDAQGNPDDYRTPRPLKDNPIIKGVDIGGAKMMKADEKDEELEKNYIFE